MSICLSVEITLQFTILDLDGSSFAKLCIIVASQIQYFFIQILLPQRHRSYKCLYNFTVKICLYPRLIILEIVWSKPPYNGCQKFIQIVSKCCIFRIHLTHIYLYISQNLLYYVPLNKYSLYLKFIIIYNLFIYFADQFCSTYRNRMKIVVQ